MKEQLLLLLLLCGSTFQAEVTLDCGVVKGNKTTTPVGDVYEFLQVPYGVPPVGARRWTHSEMLAPGPENQQCWEGVYDASAMPNPPIKCLQSYYGGSVDGQEDCLHLSVRSPDLSASLPVLVWIHGGSLMFGYGDEAGYAPTAEFTADLQVVTVNINYRLDLMGFFSSPEIWNDKENPGNYGNFGIGDALTALKWIQANIAQFGGNPDSVTLMGESSGGTVVLGLMVADQADGLFNKAIALSAPAKWVSTPEIAYSRRSTFAGDVGCNQTTEAARRTCLKTLDVESLISKVDWNRGWGFYDFPYSSGLMGESMDYNVIEPTLVKVSPYELRRAKNTENKKTKVKLIISNTAQETGYNALFYSTNQLFTWDQADALLKEKVDNLKNQTGSGDLDEDLTEQIKEKYDFCYTPKRKSLKRCNDAKWWPQIFYDTLTTDLRTTCITNSLTEEMNKNELYDVYRMYIASRPDEKKDNLSFESIHGWDTEALFGYEWFGLRSSSQRKQRKLEDSLRDIVQYFCYDDAQLKWGPDETLVIKNRDFPNVIDFRKSPPQDNLCKFWDKKNMLEWGWQN